MADTLTTQEVLDALAFRLPEDLAAGADLEAEQDDLLVASARPAARPTAREAADGPWGDYRPHPGAGCGPWTITQWGTNCARCGKAHPGSYTGGIIGRRIAVGSKQQEGGRG